MSALPPKADICQRIEHFCFVPIADIHAGASTHLAASLLGRFQGKVSCAVGVRPQEFTIVLSVRCTRQPQRVTVILDAAGVPLPAAQRVCRSLLALRTLERNSGLPPTPHQFRLSADSIDTAGSLRLHSDFRLVAAALRHVAGGCSQWQFQTQPTGVNTQQGPTP